MMQTKDKPKPRQWFDTGATCWDLPNGMILIAPTYDLTDELPKQFHRSRREHSKKDASSRLRIVRQAA